ncbi:MAG: LuxR C-terminal-related transcriptional regulator [Acidimicrobiia bacterium]
MRPRIAIDSSIRRLTPPLLLQGKRVATIAAELYISQSTVRNHLSAMFKKYQVHSQPELLEALRM